MSEEFRRGFLGAVAGIVMMAAIGCAAVTIYAVGKSDGYLACRGGKP